MMQGIVTGILLVSFLGGVVWLYVFKRPRDFDAAAHLPLEPDAAPHKEPTP